jgi:hypothetical protein
MTTIPAGTDGFPTNVQAEPPLQGQLDTPVQDRSIPHFFISEVELAMLETGSGNSDRSVSGLALGAAIAFGIADRTVKNLSPYNHALFVVGFWVLLVLAAYSAFRALRARSLNKKTAAAVRQRKTSDSPSSDPPQQSIRQRLGKWIGGNP